MANKTKTINYEELVPKCLGKLPKGPKATELRVAYDAPTNQTTFTYSITWDDAMGTEEQYKKAIDSVANKLSQRMMVVRKKKEKKVKKSEKKKNQEKKEGKIEKKVEEKEAKEVEKMPKPQEEPKVEKTVTKSPSSTASSSSSSAASAESTGSAESWGIIPPTSDVSTASESKTSEKSSEKSTSNSTTSTADSLPSPSPPRPKKCSKPARLSSRSYHEMPSFHSSDVDSSGMNDLKSVTAKLVVIETKDKFTGKFGVFSTLETTDLTHIHLVLNDLLRDYRPSSSLPLQQLLNSANLYFAYHDSGKPKLRRIRREHVKDLVFADLPKIRNHVILVLDLVGYISKGKHIPIQLALESEKEKKRRRQ